MTIDSWRPGEVVRGLVGDYVLGSPLRPRAAGVTAFRSTTERGGEVLVKQLSLSALESFAALDAFEREVRSAATLRHPGLPAFVEAFVMDGAGPRPVAELSRSSGQGALSVVLVRDFASGTSLEERIADGGRHDAATLEGILRELLGVLGHFHSLLPSVIHRDVHPRHVVVGERVWLLSDPSLDPASSLGTHGFAAPEQTAGHAEPASDLYSLAVTMLAAATHRSPAELPFDRRTGRFDVRAASTGLPERMVRALSGMLEPSVARRLRSTADVLDVLNQAPRLRLPRLPAVNPRKLRRGLAALAVGVVALSGLKLGLRQGPHFLRAEAKAAMPYDEKPEVKRSDVERDCGAPPFSAPPPVPYQPPPTYEDVVVTFGATVSASRGHGPKVGTSCVVSVRTFDEASSSCSAQVTCEGDTIYSSDESVSTSAVVACVLREYGLPGGRYEYELALVDRAPRATGERAEIFLSSRDGRAVVEKRGPSGGEMELAMEKWSDRRYGSPTGATTRFRGERRHRGRIYAVDGEGPVRKGDSCDVIATPAESGGNCRIRARCHGKEVYDGTGACSVVEGAPWTMSDTSSSPLDGNPRLELDLSLRSLTIGDDRPSGSWTAEVCLDGKPGEADGCNGGRSAEH